MGKRVIVTYIEQKLLIAQNAIASDFREVIKSSDVQKEHEVDYAIVDSFELMEKVKAEFIAKQLPTPRFIYVGRNYKLQEYFDLGGTILVDPFIFGDEVASKLIKRSMEISPALHLQEVFKDYFPKYFSYKILNIYRLGYYGDLMCKDAIGQQANFVAIRTFFDHAMLYLSHLCDLELARFSCELEYSFKNNQFVMLIHVPTTNNLKHNHLIEGFGEENSKNPISSLLRTCYKATDYLDVIHNPKTKRLTIVGLWLAEENRSQLAAPTVNLDTVGQHEVNAINQDENNNQSFQYDFEHHLSEKEFQKLEKGERPELPGIQAAVEEIEEDSVLNQEEGVLEELTSFIQEKVDLKNLEIDDPSQQVKVEDLSIDEVKQILKDHPEQELIQKLSHTDEKVLTTVISAGKGAEELVQMVSGSKKKENENVMVKIGSGAKQIAEQISIAKTMFKNDENKEEVTFINSFKDKINQDEIQILKSGLIPMEDGSETSIITGDSIIVGDEEILIPENIKKEIDSAWKVKKAQIIEKVQAGELTDSEANDYIQNEITQVIKNTIKSESGNEFVKVQGGKIPKVDDDIRVSMGNIEKELTTKFKSISSNSDPQEQAEVIISTIIQEAKQSKVVLKGSKPVEEVVSEIIENMDIPEEEKVAFTKKSVKAIKKDKKKSIPKASTTPLEEELVSIEEEVDEVIEEEVEETVIEKDTTVKKIVKKPKVVKVKKQVIVPKKLVVEEVVEEEIIEEVEEEVIEEGVPVKKTVKKPKIVQVKKQVRKAPSLVEEEETTLVEGDGEDSTELIKISSKGSKKAQPQAKFSTKNVAESQNEEEVDDVTVVTGSNEFPEGEGFTVSDREASGKKSNQKKSLQKSIIKGSSEEAEEVQHFEGKEEGEEENYKFKNHKGLEREDTDYKVKVDGKKHKNDAENTDYKVASNKTQPNQKEDDGYRVADNSHLVQKIQELEEKLKNEREMARNEARKLAAEVKNPESTEIVERKLSNEDTEKLASEVKNSTVIPEFHKEKMLEVIEHEKKINEKMAEVNDAYRKTKAALDTIENKYAQQIDELERENRHKEHLIEQVKTKMQNLERDHQLELKRASFDAKNALSGKGGSSAEVDRYKQKAAALEREKNSLKAMIEDLKKSKIKEKTNIIEAEAKTSPKVAELEAQKKRVEVRLSSAEEEIKELKKTITSKDRNSQSLGEQRLKLENESAKWKKDALTKQSELEKVNKEKTQAENEVKELKKKVDELLKSAKEVKKTDAQTQQVATDSKTAQANVKQAEEKVLALKEEFNKEKAQLNKEIGKEKELHEEAKKNYLHEANKVKALEVKSKELADKIKELEETIKAHDQAATEAEAKASNAKAAITAKDLSAVTTKNRLLDETNKKITKDLTDTKAKLEESKKEIAILTKKSNETQYKLQEKEKLAEKLQNELKEIKDKEAEAKKKEAQAKKVA